MSGFADACDNFDTSFAGVQVLPRSLVPVHGKYKDNITIRRADGNVLEEYYKWQFIYALLHSGLYTKDYIGVEVYFPKGSTSSAALKLDGAIFDSPEWIQHYNDYWSLAGRSSTDL